MRKTLKYILSVCQQDLLKHAFMVGVPSSALAAVIKFIDLRFSFLHSIMPEQQVFVSFTGTVSILLVFRAMKALNIYKEGARGLHQMIGSWLNSASTLIAFCRTSSAPIEEVDEFRNVLVRLVSLLNMLCLVELEDAEDGYFSHTFEFKTMDIDGLDQGTLRQIKEATGKPETVCQYIQCLIVDNIAKGVFTIPPPILSRSFQDLGVGMLKFNELRHLSRSPVPHTLPAVTEFLLLLHAVVSPWQLAVWTQEPVGAALCTLAMVVVLRCINGLAREIENPFGGDYNDIDTRALHDDLNLRLLELLKLSGTRGATTSMAAKRRDSHRHLRNLSTRALSNLTKGTMSSATNVARLDDWFEKLIAASRSERTRLASSNSQISVQLNGLNQETTVSRGSVCEGVSEVSIESEVSLDEVFAVPSEGFLWTLEAPLKPRIASDMPTTPRALRPSIRTPRRDNENTVQEFKSSVGVE